MTIDVPHYIPAFIWRFWLSAPGRHGPRRGPRVHIYDVDSSNLSETTRIPELGHSHSIFHDISCAFSPNSRAILDKAEREFLILQSQAEDALQQLIDAINFSTAPDTTRIPISPSNLSTIIKFFVLLRFRNGPQYRKIVQELMEPADFQISTSLFPGTKGNAVLSVYSPLFRQVRLQTILEVFCKFFQVSIWDMKPSASTGSNGTTSYNYTPRVSSSHAFKSSSDRNIRNDTCLDILNKHCWQYSRGAEVCLGIAVEEDREFILPECCFGVLDESFGGGIKESESFDCFFPILPTLALYILLDEGKSFDDGGAKFPSFIQVGTELELDIHLRNAMILSSVPRIQRSSEIFIPHHDLKTPVLELDQYTWTTVESSDSGSDETAITASNIVGQLATELNTLSAMADTEEDILKLSGPKIFFSSLPSIVRSISSYDEFRCRWMSDNFIDYSRLKQRCRQKFGMESLKKTWTLNRNIVLSDLTDEVEVIGQHPVAFGAFSDVWMGRWYDSVESKQRVVAIKYLRQVMVQNVREKLFKRLQAELLTWHQLCHRNLATLYGIMQSSTSIGMVSAWCDNGTISNYLEKKPEADRLKLIIQVASGVAYLHHFNPPVVHGDLKGGNILVNGHEQAVITDFGLSKVMEDLSNLSRSSMSESRRSTSTSFFAGSTRWMAPELLLALVQDEENGDGPDEDKIVKTTEKRAPRVTTASDVYAFASVCLEIVTGNLPYPHRKNDYSVTVDILRGVSPARGTDLQNALKHMLGTSLGPSPNSDGKIISRLVAGEKVFRDILERCWDGQSVMRPTMEEVLMRLNSEV
ncbi:kinase-like domain-containing protein [Lentinula boryana]|uniref:Kinase-like domain-containing protein n=1 Tax=Lentinula boryana TaxID=40481 RepID=A0ABQ8QAV8_9AGAR|nr:kinase-like domain-containing protein [Lentinula boryana]